MSMKVHLGKLQLMITEARERNFKPRLFRLSQPALDALQQELETFSATYSFAYREPAPIVADEQQIMGVPFEVIERDDEWVELVSVED